MTPADFHPEFIEGLRVVNNTIDPMFCLTDHSALDLQELLARDRPATIVHLHPLTGLDANPKVAWLQFPTGGADSVNVNAGILADSFMHGINPDTAYQQMLQRIDQSIQDAG